MKPIQKKILFALSSLIPHKPNVYVEVNYKKLYKLLNPGRVEEITWEQMFNHLGVLQRKGYVGRKISQRRTRLLW